MGINILGTGCYVPEQIMTNDDFTKFVDTNDEWIRTRTGICERHMAGWEPVWYMGARAAEQAIGRAGISPEDIGLIVTSSVTPDFLTPSLSSVIQRETGAVNAAAFDINAACSGFVYAVDTARRFLETDDKLKYAVVVSSEALSRFTDFTDRSTCVLFGDGAGAVVIERSDKLFSSHLTSDGTGAHFLCARNVRVAPEVAVETDFEDGFPDQGMHKLYQDGREVYKFATKALPAAVEAAAEKAGITKDDIDWFIPHQANVRIIETAAKKFNVPMERFVITLDHFGNTSSSSIPLAFNEAVEKGMIKRGQKLAFIGFGAGLTSGCAIVEY